MERVNRIMSHPMYQECLGKTKEWEKDRSFCRHNMEHFLDVARIGQILNLEETMNIEKERIYAAALLHDIGRFRQYESGIGHEMASAEIAPEMLIACGFSEVDVTEIVRAIANHRNENIREERSLTGILYRADKLSRSCFACEAESACDWKREKKNLTIVR